MPPTPKGQPGPRPGRASYNTGVLKNPLTVAVAALILLAGCAEPPKKPAPKEPPKPAVPVSGRQAFQYVYPAARTWAPDAQPIQGRNLNLPDPKSEKGRCAAWEFTFASASKGRMKSWTYSVIEAEGNLHKGTFAGQEANFTGAIGQAKPFTTFALKIDTDEALETAQKVSAEELKKVGDKQILFLLEYTPRFPNPAWRVMWGESLATSEYSVFVDAVTGQMLQKVK